MLKKKKLFDINFGVFSAVLLFILFLSSILLTFSQKVYAAPPLNPSEKAARYQAAKAFAACSRESGWSRDRSSSQLNSGEVFNNKNIDITVSVGFLIKANNDGLFGCSTKDDVAAALTTLGQNGVSYFTDAGIYVAKSGGDGFELKKDTSDEDRAKLIESYFQKKFGFSLTANMPKDAQYFNLKATFDKKCNKGEAKLGGRSVKIVDGEGNITEKNFELDRLDVSHRVGFGMDNDGGNDGFMKCGTIVDQMNAYAAAAATAQKTARGAGGSTNTGSSASSGTASTTAADDNSCESNSGPTSWFACPLINLVAGALSWVDEQINNLMIVDSNLYRSGPGATNLYKAWTGFRNIALTLLIAAMMVIVISTALGVSILDAYTVKKAFPRLIASVIFILLSWWVCVFLIDFINVIGQGVLGIMTAPFGLTNSSGLASLFDTTPGQAASTGIIAVLAAGSVFLITGASAIVLSWIGTALLVMALAFLVLVARQIFIVTLILFAPIAILAWIFPSSSKAWRFWWESFIKVLLMYPMVMALLGAGRIFASTIQASDSNTLLTPLLKLTAYVVPYAFIPFTFKAAGGLFGNLAGMANDRSRGAFDRLKKGRQKNMAAIGQRTRTGQMTKGTSAFSNRLNRGARGVMAGPSAGFGLGTRGRIFDDEQAAVEAVEMKKTAAWQGAQFKDPVMKALTHTNEAAAKKYLEDQMVYDEATGTYSRKYSDDQVSEALIGARKIGYGRTSQVAAAQQLAVNKTGYEDAKDAMDTVKRVAGGNKTLEGSLKENVKYSSKQVGRNDIGALSDRKDGETDEQWVSRMTRDGFEGVDPYMLGREHKMSFANMSKALETEYESASTAYKNARYNPGLASPDPDIQGRANAQLKEAADRLKMVRGQSEEVMKNANSNTGVNAREVVKLTETIANADLDLLAFDKPFSDELHEFAKTGLGAEGAFRGPSSLTDDAARRRQADENK